ncbi:MAG: putative Ig domain-containing protein [Pirellulaceae bacterium]
MLDKTLSFTASATDANGDDITYSLNGVPTGASITPTGVFTWTPTASPVGSHSIEIIVTDDGSPAKTASETIEVTVNEVVLPAIGEVRFEIGEVQVGGDTFYVSLLEVTELGDSAGGSTRIDLQRAGNGGFSRLETIGTDHEASFEYETFAELVAAHDGEHSFGIDYDGDGDHEATFTIDIDLTGFTMASFPESPNVTSPLGEIEDTTPAHVGCNHRCGDSVRFGRQRQRELR